MELNEITNFGKDKYDTSVKFSLAIGMDESYLFIHPVYRGG